MKKILSSALLTTGLLFGSEKALGSSLEKSFEKDTVKRKIDFNSNVEKLNFIYSEVLSFSLADVNKNGKFDGKFVIYKIEYPNEGIISAYYPLEIRENEELFFSKNALFIIDKNDAYLNKSGKGVFYDKTSYEELSKWLQNSYDPYVEVE